MNWIPSLSVWKKITTSSYNSGNIQNIYWKIAGEKPDKTIEESEVRDFRIGPLHPAAIDSPANGAQLPAGTPPAFSFSINCNTKLKLEFSTLTDFSDSKKIRTISYSTKDPNTGTSLDKTLSSSQWSSVKKLVGTGTGYFRIRAWDGLNRESVSEVRMFTIQ